MLSQEEAAAHVAAAAARTAARLRANPDWSAKVVREAVQCFFEDRKPKDNAAFFDLFSDRDVCLIEKGTSEPDSVEEHSFATDEGLAFPTYVCQRFQDNQLAVNAVLSLRPTLLQVLILMKPVQHRLRLKKLRLILGRRLWGQTFRRPAWMHPSPRRLS